MKPTVSTLYITGIDTNIGKTYATAFLANHLRQQGANPITQKLIQTGCQGISEDIVKHRELLGEPLGQRDLDMTTSPYVLSYPASPHLAAKLDSVTVDIQRITDATQRLSDDGFRPVLVECAGGLMVPITERLLTIDYIAQLRGAVVLVTCGRLGSLNHTLLSLEAINQRHLSLPYVIYNAYPSIDQTIETESIHYLQEWLKAHWPDTELLIMPEVK